MRRIATALAVLALLVASPAAAGLKRPRRGFQMRMGRFVIPPGHEREVCQFRTLPNAQPMEVQSFELDQSPGSHHFVVWAYLGSDRKRSDFPSGIVDSPGCVGVGPDIFERASLFGMQTAHGKVSFPPGVAIRLDAHQPVFLNSHYINGSPFHELVPRIAFNMTAARPGSVRHHAESLTVGNYDIHIPAQGTAKLVSEWTAPVDLNVIQLSSHQHKRGTHVSIERIVGGQLAGSVFENDDWQEPVERWLPVPLRVNAGDGFRFTCEWRNPDPHPVAFGVTTNDEMCFMTGFYYRDDESKQVPRGPGCLLDRGILCPARTVAKSEAPL